MIVPDVNLLVYAYNEDAPDHMKARRWWEDALGGTETVGLAWVVCLGFLRLMTSRRVLLRPWSSLEVIGFIRSWLVRSQVELLQPGPRHLDILQSFAQGGVLSSDLATDAHIAALAMEHQAVVHSGDADFGRFPGIRFSNPLAR